MNKQQYDEFFRQFEAGLANLRYELQKNLNEFDPLEKDRLKSMIEVFGQRLIIFQHDFLKYISLIKGGAESTTEEFIFQIPETDQIPELAAGILAGSTGSLLLIIIPAGTTGHLWWATSIGLGAVIASALGWPVWLVVAVLSIGGGGVVYKGIKNLLAVKRRDKIRGAVVKWFDNDIAPKLREWCKLRISE